MNKKRAVCLMSEVLFCFGFCVCVLSVKFGEVLGSMPKLKRGTKKCIDFVAINHLAKIRNFLRQLSYYFNSQIFLINSS